MIKKVVIANRGEIALRILRACKELGIQTVAVHSTADRNLKHVKLADESICIGGNLASQSYLNVPAIIAAAEVSGADAIHPGVGFLSENADFAEQVERSGFTFIGSSFENIRLMGDKISAIELMKKVGIPCISGSGLLNANDDETNKNIAREIGYPVIIKASAGGGGLGMKVVYEENELIDAIHCVTSDAKRAFNNDAVYMEKFLQHPRHIEIQIVADNFGNVVHLGDRDCSLQRRHQKVVEEAPAYFIDQAIIEDIRKKCIKACKKIGYRGLGTFEFLFEDGQFYFIEMNTRLQVEHTITEMITGIDLVKEQLKIASNLPLGFSQKDVKFKGCAIECRINAEDSESFMPSPGLVDHVHIAGGFGVRWDSHIYSGYQVPPYYDSLIGKLVVWAEDRTDAITKMQIALEEMVISGIKTNIELHSKILAELSEMESMPNIHYLFCK